MGKGNMKILKIKKIIHKSMSMANRLLLQGSVLKRSLYSRPFRLSVTTSKPTCYLQWHCGHSYHSLVPKVWARQQHSYLHSHAHERGNLLYDETIYDETIYALSTGSGRAGIAIIRVSGPACLDVCLPSPHNYRHANEVDIQ